MSTRLQIFPMRQMVGTCAKRLFTSPALARVSSVTATPILPMSRSLSTAPKCAWRKLGPSTAPSQSLRDRHLLGRRNRVLRRTTANLPRVKKTPPQPANGNNGGPKVRDRLCQIIRQHQLDPNLVKAYATDFCGVKTLRDATREQVENFVTHLADWAEKDRNALLCQLNSYPSEKEGAA